MRLNLPWCAGLGAVLAMLCSAPLMADDGSEGEQRANRAGQSLIGTQAPDLRIAGMNGEVLDLAAARRDGRPVYLKFWATWCIPCREQMPHLQETYNRHGDRIEMMAVNIGFNDSKTAVANFQRRQGLSVPVAFDEDGSIGRNLGLRVSPTHVLIDAQGVIRHTGFKADKALDAKIAKLADGAMPAATLKAASTAATETLPLTPGKPTVLAFVWAWCESYLAESRPQMSKACQAQREGLTKAREQYGDRFNWQGVAGRIWTNEAEVADYRKQYKVEMPVALDADGRWFGQYQVREVPTVVLLDAKGRERYRSDELGTAFHTCMQQLQQGGDVVKC